MALKEDVSKLDFPLETLTKSSQSEPDVSNMIEGAVFSPSFTPKLCCFAA